MSNPPTDGQRPSRLKAAVKWLSRAYIAFAAVEGAGVVLFLADRQPSIAVERAAAGLGFLATGAAGLVATRLDWPRFNSAEMRRARELDRAAFRTSRLKWVFAPIAVVQFGVLAVVVYLLVQHH